MTDLFFAHLQCFLLDTCIGILEMQFLKSRWSFFIDSWRLIFVSNCNYVNLNQSIEVNYSKFVMYKNDKNVTSLATFIPKALIFNFFNFFIPFFKKSTSFDNIFHYHILIKKFKKSDCPPPKKRDLNRRSSEISNEMDLTK